jgi:hypothetical protein
MRFFLFGPRIAGIRTGISIGPEDFRSAGQPRSAAAANDPNESFLYVVKSDSGLCKIGITSNPNARLAQLRSASVSPLEFAWIGAPKDQTVAIEREAHKMLAQYLRGGEWFAVAPDAAVGAVHAAAFRLGQPVLDLDATQAERIRQIAVQQPTRKPPTVWSRIGEGVLQLLVGAALAVAVLVFLAFSIGRIIF